MYRILSIFILFIFLTSCSGSKNNTTPFSGSDVEKLSHARLFSIRPLENSTELTILNPWREGEVYQKYYLVKSDSIATPDDGIKVQIPLQSVMANSATNIGFLDQLGVVDKVVGVSGSGSIYHPIIQEEVKAGAIVDLGDSFNLDIERLLLLRPQAVITTAYNADDENSNLLRRSGLTILYNIEWQESTLLGRAEWIKFFGALFDKQDEANEIFHAIEQNYYEAKKLVADIKDKPTILSGQDFRGSWSMPGGKSFNAQLYKDAGGDYYFKDDETIGSISSTIESALVDFGKADVWVGVQANTLEELGKIDSKYKLFNAYKTGNVYNINNRTNETGGNDYWEWAVVRPDLLLADLIKILHPEILPDYKLVFYKKLQ